MSGLSFSKSQVFFAVNAFACVGLNIGVIGVNWFIIDVTGSNRLLGIYGALSLISAFFALALAGTLTDRYSKLTLLQFCCTGQAILFFVTAVLNIFQIPVIQFSPDILFQVFDNITNDFHI